MRKAICIVAALGAATATPASAKTERFQPSSTWAVDYGEDHCRLMRNFTNGKRTLTIALHRRDLGPELALEVAGDSVRLSRRATSVTYSYGPEGETREGEISANLQLGGENIVIHYAPIMPEFAEDQRTLWPTRIPWTPSRWKAPMWCGNTG